MARIKDREKAVSLRLKGYSYSQIKAKMDISKSTLSNWLHDYPLPAKKIRELRDWNPRRIENFRNTMRRKRETRLDNVYLHVQKRLSKISDRERFLAGLFLYWAEGTKVARYVTALANSDPAMVSFFIKWLESLGVKRDKLIIRLHLYSDMNIKKETKFWMTELDMPRKCFKVPYIKPTKRDRITYKGGYGHGTCNVIYNNRDMQEFVAMALKHIKKQIV